MCSSKKREERSSDLSRLPVLLVSRPPEGVESIGMRVPLEAVKVKKRRGRACLVGVCCHRGPGCAESEWVGPLGSPDYPEKTRGSRRQGAWLREGAWLQRCWRAPQWRPGESL